MRGARGPVSQPGLGRVGGKLMSLKGSAVGGGGGCREAGGSQMGVASGGVSGSGGAW